ncbi:MAG: PSD1 domain-containing protein [Bryobacterales bacterium]|nr:PSD1 domain-containing protein [Bryobacterales bacterium]
MAPLAVLALAALAGSASAADFQKDVRPIFVKRCAGCHGAANQMNGFRVDRRDEALRGGYSGPALVPGDSANSRLTHLLTGQQSDLNPKSLLMPPGKKLPDAEVAVLKAWIDAGAVWPEERAATAKRSSHWAFAPPEKTDAPAVRDGAWVRNPIDRFVLAKLEAKSITPSPEADKATLLRRISLDLTGLPPSPGELRAFLADASPDAYERAVDRLLASPHYGERWARWWLDQARYADSDGFQKDLVRPHAWRYRNWVINALNDGMPFDRFTIEQIAGDLLPPSASPEATVEQIVATGFHRNTLTNREGGSDPGQYRYEQLVDRTNTTGLVWMGLTMGCAQCHDHKYDPISQKDYYSLFAFFENAEEKNIDAPLPGEMGPYLRVRPDYVAARRALLDEYKIPPLQAEWEKYMIEAADSPNYKPGYDAAMRRLRVYLDHGERILRKPNAARTEDEARMLTAFFAQDYSVVVPAERYKELRFDEFRKKLAKLDASFPGLTKAMTLTEAEHQQSTHVHIRGDWARKGVAVTPAVPEVLPPLPQGKPPRLALAEWLVARDNPLTARVIVNRLWQEYFGRGLVNTPDDFGTRGAQPTHPELLDWLAVTFMDQGWDLKKVHRLIVTSAAYRQASHVRQDLQTVDPYNELIARQSRLRLPAELVRDAALAASGLLVPTIGGKSVVLSKPAKREDTDYAGELALAAKGSPEVYRRGLYLHFQRKTPDPMLMNFDAPNSFAAVCRRERSNTPLQALNLLNDPAFYESAQALAVRVLREAGPSFNERTEHLFQLCLSRAPEPRETERLLSYFMQEKRLLEGDAKAIDAAFPFALRGVDPAEGAAWVGASRVVLNLDQFITRE